MSLHIEREKYPNGQEYISCKWAQVTLGDCVQIDDGGGGPGYKIMPAYKHGKVYSSIEAAARAMVMRRMRDTEKKLKLLRAIRDGLAGTTAKEAA